VGRARFISVKDTEGRRRAEGGQKEGGRRAGGHESFSKKQPQFLPGFDCNEDFVTPIT
jgi:hypothetical protein